MVELCYCDFLGFFHWIWGTLHFLFQIGGKICTLYRHMSYLLGSFGFSMWCSVVNFFCHTSVLPSTTCPFALSLWSTATPTRQYYLKKFTTLHHIPWYHTKPRKQDWFKYIDGSRAVDRISPNCSFPQISKWDSLTKLLSFYLQDFKYCYKTLFYISFI